VAGQQTVPSLASNPHPVWMMHHNIANNALTGNKNDEKSMKNDEKSMSQGHCGGPESQYVGNGVDARRMRNGDALSCLLQGCRKSLPCLPLYCYHPFLFLLQMIHD
jgi:hypothetical protein